MEEEVGQHRPGRLRDRPTGDLLVLMIAGTVCIGVLASGLTIAVVSLVNPDVDVSHWIARITGTINTMVGLLAGFLAGKSSRRFDSNGQDD